ncbi:hypothetical protein C1645_743187 [Glomus cerebriforme]|uniref:Uncharacterized protein n=1 Tax=Glomus cerebriforme TaxID=658196 RepID=A0A397SA94_9GLOM|nr:hypothetical protein C1645_743187 [Glomus cerebriforme]
MTEADFKKLPAVFSCKLPIILDEVFNTIYHRKKMKQALQSSAHLTALIDRLVDIRDSELNPHKIFKAVIPKKLKNGVLATIHDEKSVVYRIINPEEIQHEKTLGGGMEKFAYHVEVVGGMIPFTNSWALVKRLRLESHYRNRVVPTVPSDKKLEQELNQVKKDLNLILSNQLDKQKELEEFLKDNQANKLEDIIQLLVQYEQEIEKLKKTKKGTLSEEEQEKLNSYEELEAERDELRRSKEELEQEFLAVQNRLKLSRQEVIRKDETITEMNQRIELLKKDQKDLKQKYTKQKQAQSEQERLQKLLDDTIEILGKEEVKNITDLRDLLQDTTLPELVNYKSLLEQKITEQEKALFNLAKKKIQNQKEAREILTNLETD